ncbi:hypothetical protein KEJ45_04265 [Candidatus Bathyarchaeota archaeon]|nr:hypothetical protein [Candidatus Bathyarchaeota archaeon]
MQPKENSRKGVVKVRSWTEFKNLVETCQPKAIVYNIEQDGLSPKRELTKLRLILSAEHAYYVLVDSLRGETLRETNIPVRRDKKGNLYIEEEDVVRFLKSQFKREDMTICSYWTI